MNTSQQIAKNMKVVVTTTIFQNDEKETFELTTFGQLLKKREALYLQYEEVLEDLTVHTTVKITDQKVVILRSGDLSMKMVLQEAISHKGYYKNPVGSMEIETRAKRLHSQLTDAAGKIDILYDFYAQSEIVGTYYLQLKFEEENR